MKKCIFLFFTANFFTVLNAQSLDSARFWRRDTDNNTWHLTAKSYYSYSNGNIAKKTHLVQTTAWDSLFLAGNKDLYSYDSNNNLIEKITMLRDGVGWKNHSRWTYIINTFNKPDTVISQLWNGSDWGSYNRYIYSYDFNGNKILEWFQLSNMGNWINDHRDFYTYDNAGNILSQERQAWIDNAWVNNFKNLRYYDSNNNKIKIENFGWMNLQWTAVGRSLYSYNPANLITEYIEQIPGGTSWYNVSRDTSIYNSQGKLISLLRQTESGGWKNYMNILYSYDTNNNCKDMVELEWSGQEWLNKMKYLFTTNIYGLKESMVNEGWNGTAWDLQDSSFYYYRNVNGIKINNFSQIPSLKIYPNPTSGRLIIASSLDNAFINIRDVLGNRVYSGWVQKEVVIDLSNKPKGIYLLELNANGLRELKKIAVE